MSNPLLNRVTNDAQRGYAGFRESGVRTQQGYGAQGYAPQQPGPYGPPPGQMPGSPAGPPAADPGWLSRRLANSRRAPGDGRAPGGGAPSARPG